MADATLPADVTLPVDVTSPAGVDEVEVSGGGGGFAALKAHPFFHGLEFFNDEQVDFSSTLKVPSSLMM